MSVEALEQALERLPECELRRCARKALELGRGFDDVPARLRDIDRCLFRAFGVRDVPADMLDADYGAAMTLLDLLWAVQAAVRRDLYDRFGLRCITAPLGEPYDERSPRYVAATARPTGNPSLDWHVADTATCGYEWNGAPRVLLPARVDVYRYDEAVDDEALARPEPVPHEPLVEEPSQTAEMPAPALTLLLPDGTEQRFAGPLRLRIEEGPS